MRIPEQILKKAFEIGFNYKKERDWENPICSVPCEVTLKNGEIYEQAELILIEKLFNNKEYKCFQIEEVDSICDSKYALDFEIRKASIETIEYRNDWPFFIRTNKNQILGFNAIQPVNFTYNNEIKGSEIGDIVDFQFAQKQGFEFIKDHYKKSVKIICGLDLELIDKIKNVYNIN